MTNCIDSIKADFQNFQSSNPNKTRGALWVTAAIVTLAVGCAIAALGLTLVYFSVPISSFLFSSLAGKIDLFLPLTTVLSLGMGLTISGIPVGIWLACKCAYKAHSDFQ